jgi:hypothetical protein
MEMAFPTGRSGRLAALGIAAILAILAWLLLVQPLVDLHADRARQLDRDRQLLARMEGLAASLPALRGQTAQLRQGGEHASFTIEGASDAVAAANLQGMLQDMATAVSASITSFETVPGQTVGSYRRIGLKLTLHETWPVLIALLRSIEEADTPMLVDDLEVHALPMLNPQNGQRLQASLTVYGFRAGTEAP